MMKLLIIGCGSIGRRHLRNILSFVPARLVSVYDVQSERSKEVSKKYKVTGYPNFPKALSAGADVVFITTPTALHMRYALMAARAGKHMFIEKPISHTLRGMGELQKLCRAKRLTVMVGYNWRFHPAIRAIRELLTRRKIGKVISARIECGSYLPEWHPREDHRKGYSANKRLGGGVVLDAVHELDYAIWLFGIPERLFSFGGRRCNITVNTEDTASMLVRFASGVITEIHLDYIQRPRCRTCKIVGEKGVIEWSEEKDAVRYFNIDAQRWEIYKRFSSYDPDRMYIDEMRHFLDCVKKRKRPLVGIQEAKRSLVLALAAKESMRTGAAVALPRGALW